jgi:Fic family protein
MQGQGVTHAGAYRTINVMAAGTGHAYPGHLHVRELMDEYTAWLGAPSERHPALRAAEAHLRFVTIHPFADGNGRLGRLLMNLLLVRTGYPIAVIPVQRRAEYIDALSAAQSGANAARHNQLVLDAVAASLKETLTVCVTAADMPDAAMSVLPGIRRWLEAKEG